MSEPQRTETGVEQDSGAAKADRGESLAFALGPTGDTSKGAPGGTVDFEPPPKPASPGETMDSPPPDEFKEPEPVPEQKTEGNLRIDGGTCDFTEAPQEVPAVERPSVEGYDILDELGRGGMGVVYKARQVKLDRIVALKMILAGAHAGKDQLSRFYTEAQAVAHLQHPNIIQIYEVSEQAGLPYFSLEFVDGGSLSDKCGGKPQPPKEAALMVQKLAGAMHHAHEHNVVHRDLKPANILITSQGVPKITDFGLAKRLEGESSSQTRSGSILGTPSYMAPEQAMGEVTRIGPLTDVYSLGAMLYELITGRPPFLAATPMDTVMQVVRDEPVPPSQLQPTLQRDLETICLKCLQKEQSKRYETADALADDLRRFLAGEPILARPVSAPERLWRWCRRNPKIAALSTAVAMLLVTVAIVSTTMAFQIAHERDQTEIERKEAVKARDLATQKEQEAVEARDLASQKARDEESAKQVAQEAEKKASENAKIAGDQRRLALETLHKVITSIEEKLRDRSDMTDLRQGVLKQAMEGLESLSRTDENLSFADRTVGAGHQRLGDVLLKAGRCEDALQQFKRALRIFERLLQEDPHNDLALYNAGLSYESLGDVSRELGEDAAVTCDFYRKGLELREALALDHHSPQLTDEVIGVTLTNSNARLGNAMLTLMGDPAAARQYYEKVFQLSQGLAAKNSKTVAARQVLAGSYYLFGRVRWRLGEVDQARRDLDKALELRQALYDESPESVKSKQDMALSLWAFGEMELHLGQPKVALERYRSAHEFRVALHEKEKDNSEMQWDLSGSFYRLGTALACLDNAAEAEQNFGDCQSLRETVSEKDPNNVAKLIDLMLAQARCGEHVKAAKIASTLRKRIAKNPGGLFAIACAQALSAESKGFGKRAESGTVNHAAAPADAETAIAVLTEAIAVGYKDVTALKTQPELKSIRGLPQFSTLIENIERK